MIEDRHRGLKRWEKARQMAGLAANPELVGPLAWCRVRTAQVGSGVGETTPGNTRVYILRIFTKDLVAVHVPTELVPKGLPGPCWLVRGGIDWPIYLREIVRQYAMGRPVPESFRPRRKIPAEIIRNLQSLPDRDLPAVFAKMRDSGLLPSLPILDKSNCPTPLIWDNLRADFQDFHEDSLIKDNPLL